jgi:hypothetical protein
LRAIEEGRELDFRTFAVLAVVVEAGVVSTGFLLLRVEGAIVSLNEGIRE